MIKMVSSFNVNNLKAAGRKSADKLSSRLLTRTGLKTSVCCSVEIPIFDFREKRVSICTEINNMFHFRRAGRRGREEGRKG